MFPCVDANRQIRNITLSGFMGCGKTAVGRIVAKVAGFEFLDTDQFIEEHVGKSIPRIFEEHGEETFRRYEREVVVRLADPDAGFRDHILLGKLFAAGADGAKPADKAKGEAE